MTLRYINFLIYSIFSIPFYDRVTELYYSSFQLAYSQSAVGTS